MRKILFSGLAFVAFATAGFANSTELKMEKELNTMELIYPCNALLLVYDTDGNLVDHLLFFSDVDNGKDCADNIWGIVREYQDRYPGYIVEVKR
ncbi:MAG: hypothetical protein WCY89_11895 [Flavobacteriaceae bacterium]